MRTRQKAGRGRWVPRVALGVTFGYLSAHVAAYALGMEPGAFFRLAGAVVGTVVGVCAVTFGTLVVLAQLFGGHR